MFYSPISNIIKQRMIRTPLSYLIYSLNIKRLTLFHSKHITFSSFSHNCIICKENLYVLDRTFFWHLSMFSRMTSFSSLQHPFSSLSLLFCLSVFFYRLLCFIFPQPVTFQTLLILCWIFSISDDFAQPPVIATLCVFLVLKVHFTWWEMFFYLLIHISIQIVKE